MPFGSVDFPANLRTQVSPLPFRRCSLSVSIGPTGLPNLEIRVLPEKSQAIPLIIHSVQRTL